MFNVLFGCGGIPKKTCLLLNTLVKAFTNQYRQRGRYTDTYLCVPEQVVRPKVMQFRRLGIGMTICLNFCVFHILSKYC